MKFDLNFVQGEDVSIIIPTKKDYTGFSARMQARPHPSDEEMLFEVTPTIEEGRKVVIDIPSSVTNEFDWTRAVYDVEMTSPGGDISFPIFGNIHIRKRITR